MTAGFAQSVLFQPAASPSLHSDQGPAEPGVLRHRQLNLNATVARDLVTTDSGAELRLDLFDDVRFLVSLKNQTATPEPGSYTWTGQVKGQPLATFNMAGSADVTLMDIRIPGGLTYSVRYRGNGVHEVQEISEAAQGTCATTGTLMKSTPHSHGLLQPLDPTVAADAADQIDVLVAYTQDAETQAGGAVGMQTLINLAFSHANVSYTNSQIPLSILKVATVKVNYTPNTDMGVDLALLRGTDDGHMDEVHAVRDAYKADMVCLFRGNTSSGACGIAYLMGPSSINNNFAPSAFAVCANTCVSNQTFAHELGHNMGCHHDLANGGGSPAYSYAYGWRWNGSPSGLQWRSVMAYAPGNRVQYFSNPAVNYDGTPTGVAGTANNALTITNTANAVANFRQRATASGPTIASSTNNITLNVASGSDASFTVYLGNAGTGTVNYTVTENVAWATLNSGSGTAVGTGTPNAHILSFDVDSFAAGTYNASLTITAAGVANSPKIIPIVVNVTGPVVNDHFANASVITGPNGTINGSNTNATRESGEPATVGEFFGAGSHSIWYKWIAPSASQVTFSTLGSSFDTLLGAYTGTLGSLTLVRANDESGAGGGASQINFTPTASTTYYILIDGYEGAMGTTKLTWSSAAGIEDWALFQQ